MEEEFWQERWRSNQTAFHEGRPNDLLLEHFDHLELRPGDTVFVPLCGKTLDLDWLLARQLRVVGIEFNRQAVEEVFSRQSLVPEIQNVGTTVCFRAGALVIYVGDFFELVGSVLGDVTAIYDRAALVALPDETRSRYGEYLAEITGHARQLLISFDYDQSQTHGPPFSVPEQEIRRLYGSRYNVELLSSRSISGRLAQRCNGNEEAWLLEPIGAG